MIVKQLIEHWPEIALITVPTGHLAYVTQFNHAHRRHHREVIVTIVKVTVNRVIVGWAVWRITWDATEEVPWWRRVLRRLTWPTHHS